MLPTTYPVQVSISGVRREWSAVGIRESIFAVQVTDAGNESMIEMKMRDLHFLHEELLRLNGYRREDLPNFPGLPLILHESTSHLDSQRIKLEEYLQGLICCRSCVVHEVLWISLGLDSLAGIVPRFLLLRDNIFQLNELSMRSDQMYRLMASGIIPQIIRFLDEHLQDVRICSVACETLVRVSALLPVDRISAEPPQVLPSLYTILGSKSNVSELIPNVIGSLVSVHPSLLFTYLQRDGGFDDLTALVGIGASDAVTLTGVSESILAGLLASTDICICLSEKSSKGMTLMNAILARSQGMAAEIIAMGALCYLLKKGYLDSFFRSKISKILETIVARQQVFSHLPYHLVPILIGPSDSPVDEPLLILGCFLVIAGALQGRCEDEEIEKSLVRIISANSLSERAKNIAVEAVVMAAGSEQALARIKSHLRLPYFAEKVAATNSYLIEVNFKISSMDLGIALSDLEELKQTHIGVPATSAVVCSLVSVRSSISIAHKQILDNVLRLMNLLGALQTELSGPNSGSLKRVNAELYKVNSEQIPLVISQVEALQQLVDEGNDTRSHLRGVLYDIRGKITTCLHLLGNPDEEGFVTPDTPQDDAQN